MQSFSSRAPRVAFLAMASTALLALPAQAQLAVSANDGKLRLENGIPKVVKDGVDTLMLIDLSATPLKPLAEIKAPASVVGPPFSVAITPKEDIALVSNATRNDGTDPTKQVPDDTLTVVDLRGKAGATLVKNVAARIKGQAPPPAYAPEVIATLKAGLGAAGIAINRAGTLALVANRAEGTVSVFSINGKTVAPVGEKVRVGDEKSGPSAIVITPDGKRALVTRDNDHKITLLSIDGNKVMATKRDISAGLRPYGIDMSPKGDIAVLANLGANNGDADTVSVIDMTLEPPRVVFTTTVGQTPEGIKFSPDGNWVAVNVVNGTNRAKDLPFYSETGKLVILRRQGKELAKVTEANVGRWCQGLAWASNSRKVVAQCMVEETIYAFTFNGRQLTPAGTLKTQGGPAAIRTAEK